MIKFLKENTIFIVGVVSVLVLIFYTPQITKVIKSQIGGDDAPSPQTVNTLNTNNTENTPNTTTNTPTLNNYSNTTTTPTPVKKPTTTTPKKILPRVSDDEGYENE